MIEVKNLYKKYKQKVLFNNFSLTIKPGTIVAIAGPSGCGKTTLLNIIGGLETCDSGQILIDNKDIKSYKQNSVFRNKISYLFQNFALIDDKSILENLKIALGKNIDVDQVLALMSELNLEMDLNTPIYMLSGGEQQRVSMIRIILKNNPIILADEPTGSLDPNNRDIILNLLVRLKEEGKTIVLVTHDKIVSGISDEIIEI